MWTSHLTGFSRYVLKKNVRRELFLRWSLFSQAAGAQPEDADGRGSIDIYTQELQIFLCPVM